GPARMRHAEPAGERLAVELVLELRDLADGAAQAELLVALHDGDAGGVVAAVLEALQALHEHRNDVAFCDCADNAAHSAWSLLGFLLRSLPTGNRHLLRPRERELAGR